MSGHTSSSLANARHCLSLNFEGGKSADVSISLLPLGSTCYREFVLGYAGMVELQPDGLERLTLESTKSAATARTQMRRDVVARSPCGAALRACSDRADEGAPLPEPGANVNVYSAKPRHGPLSPTLQCNITKNTCETVLVLDVLRTCRPLQRSDTHREPPLDHQTIMPGEIWARTARGAELLLRNRVAQAWF
ncbi:MAG: hypothetical protein QOJ15_6628 [Bradyrhizobium sp.]|nr:hypothetical protein [Bradyrhizobium sp.]